ncbi:META domain-containing protein [Micromonospora thermarum]|uniref:META domain-containing protein n=1 Tax=Micromonospora thermarum TaxID=2720024 RepID=A0ABX0ZD75_9ACTN|nr:META domain-containing protein [Micromonospora thermarum]NJP34919.1 hypothetical protein [Micromonospora thermarum]
MHQDRYVIGSVALAVLLLAGCAGTDSPGTPAPPSPAATTPAVPQEPTGLVGAWAVSGREVPADTVLRLADDGLLVFRGCEMLLGEWRADQSGLFLAGVHTSSTTDDRRCDPAPRPEAPDWLARAAGFRAEGESRVLLDADGGELARLRPGARPRGGPNVYRPWLEPPTVTDEMRRRLAPVPALPGNLAAPTRDDLVGRWLPVAGPDGRTPTPGSGNWPTPPFAELAADGTWRASDGCNSSNGQWAAGPGGAFGATGGGSTLIGCNNVPVNGWLSAARQAGLDGDVLVLRDAQGKETGRLRRG